MPVRLVAFDLDGTLVRGRNSLARRFGVAHWAAARFSPDGTVTPFWPEDKGPWLERLRTTLNISLDEVAAVGDSPRDASLLRACGHAFYVGSDHPKFMEDVQHYPDGNMVDIARAILRL
jgi:phosphoserine phosphatase